MTAASLPVVSGVFLGIVLIPAAAASVSAFLLARNIRRLAAVAGAGLALAAVFVVYRSPTAHAPHGCSDCGLYLGRWWEPAVILVVVVFGLVGWLGGAGVGATARWLLRR